MSIIAKGVRSLVHLQLWPAGTRRHHGAAADGVNLSAGPHRAPCSGGPPGLCVFRDEDLGFGLLLLHKQGHRCLDFSMYFSCFV